MRKVTIEEINKIEAILIKKDVVYYDVKMELLDHVCTGIENEWEQNPDLSFEAAYDKEYKKFGIFGYSDVLEKRELDLNRYYWKSIGLHMLNWIKIPQIFLTILLTYCLFSLLISEYNIWTINTIIVTLALIGMVKSTVLIWQNKKKIRLNQPVMIMDNIIAQACGFTYFITIIVQGQLFNFEPMMFDNLQLIMWTFVLLIYILLNYHLIYDFPKNKAKYFRHNYIMA